MYRGYYRLTKNPFAISPDPHFYFPTSQHDEALANLWFGIHQRKGCIVLTGEVGTGKTLVVRYLLDLLCRTDIKYAYVFNPRLSPDDFLQYALSEFGVKSGPQTRGQMLSTYHDMLIDLLRRGSTAALIIDEAHLLSWDLLEEVRLLTNLETSQHKLLQIVLVGQSEFDRRLEAPELRQLKQRISLRCRLEGLDESQVSGYIAKRMRLAGVHAKFAEIFPPETIARIHQYSKGIPRIINTICETALITGYAHQSFTITPVIIDEIAKDFYLQDNPPVPAAPESPVEKLPVPENGRLLKTLVRLITLLEDEAAASTSQSKSREPNPR